MYLLTHNRTDEQVRTLLDTHTDAELLAMLQPDLLDEIDDLRREFDYELFKETLADGIACQNCRFSNTACCDHYVCPAVHS